MKRAGVRRLRRNLAVAIGNSGDRGAAVGAARPRTSRPVPIRWSRSTLPGRWRSSVARQADGTRARDPKPGEPVPDLLPDRPTLRSGSRSCGRLQGVRSLQARHADGLRRRAHAGRHHDGRGAAGRRGGSGRASVRRAGREAARSGARGGGDRPPRRLPDQRREALQVGAARQATDPREAERRRRSAPAGRGSRRRSRWCKPRMLVCLGATAAQALLGKTFKVSQRSAGSSSSRRWRRSSRRPSIPRRSCARRTTRRGGRR